MKVCNEPASVGRWRAVLGVLAVGVFACSLSLYGAPKEKSGSRGASDAVRKSVENGIPFPVSRVPMAPPVLAHPSRNILIEEGSSITGARDEANAGMVAALSLEPTGCERDIECDDCRPCTTDTCEAEVCVYTNRWECDLCDDSYFCNGTDKCDDSGNCVAADQIKMYLCNDGPNQGLTCINGDIDCAACVDGTRDGDLCCPKDLWKEGVCDGTGTCVDGKRDGLECCPEGVCFHGTCKLQPVNPDPCRFFPTVLCDEEEPYGAGLTGVCVVACFTDLDCDDGRDCNGGEICVKDSNTRGHGHGGRCIGGPTPRATCKADAECGAGGQCGGVCRPDPADPPPCGRSAMCEEGPPVLCYNGRCCSVDSADPTGFICCRVDGPNCLANGCEGGVAPHTFLGVGDLPITEPDDGSCTERSTVPSYPFAGESFACPKYSAGISTGEIVDVWGTTGVSTCHDYWEIGDDYCLQNCDPNEWYEVHTIRWVGGHVRGFESRMRFTFYDIEGRFIEDVITEFDYRGGIALRTVLFSEDPVIPCCGYITNKPAVQFSPNNRAEWTTTGVANIQAGSNDPDNVVIRRHGVCSNSPSGCSVDTDCPDGTCVVDDSELKWGAPLEVVSAASLGLQSGVLAFEIVGEKVAAIVGACCDVESGKCIEELPWICEEAGNVFQGIGTSCNVCSNDPFLACHSSSDCRHCQGGDRNGEVCCPNDGECVAGICLGGGDPLDGGRNGLECCPDGGTCEDTPVCLPSPPACQITACCDKQTGNCIEVDANQCVGGETPGDPCTSDEHCAPGGVCVRAGGRCEDGGVTPGLKCISDNDCRGLCTGGVCDDGTTPCKQDFPDCDGLCTGGLCDDGTTPCKQDSPDCDGNGTEVCNFDVICASDDDCASAGVNGPCVAVVGSCNFVVDCTSDDDCASAGVNGPCVGEECVAPCPAGYNPAGFGTTCDPNCCEPPAYSGADLCTVADMVVINVPPFGSPPVTYTFRGNNKFATFGDFIPEGQGGPGTCNYSIFDPEGDVRDRGWWYAICTDDCADIRIDLCCTGEISGETFGEQWPFLLTDCDPCTTFVRPDIVGEGSYLDEPIGSASAPTGQGAPFCSSDDPWQTYKALPIGHYFIPIYSAPDGHIGEYQLHITVGACAHAACCLPESVCLGGPLLGESCANNDDCAPDKGDKICVGGANRPDKLCCPASHCDRTSANCVGGTNDGLPCGNDDDCPAGGDPVGVCDNHPTNPVCVGGSRDTLACCDGGGECRGNCVSECVTARQRDCEALGGYWMGSGNIPPDQPPITECQPEGTGSCREYGSCCIGPGNCRDDSNPACVPADPETWANCCQPDGTNCMDRKLCDVLGGTFVGEAMCGFPLDPCPACEIQGDDNCTLCNDADFLVTLSDLTVPPGGVVFADDFVPEGTTIDTLCVWGTYLDASNQGQYNHSCSGAVQDNFRVRVYTDGKGMPGDLIAERWVEDPPKSSVPDCLNWTGTYETNLPLDVVTLSFPAIWVAAGETHWLEVANKTNYRAGATEPTQNTCYWHWMQVWSGVPDGSTTLGNRVSATGSDDRCSGGYYDNYSCTSDDDCSGGTCKAGRDGGYIEGSQRWAGQMFCLGNQGAGVNFMPGDVITGACCRCDETCEENLSQADCADFSAASDRRWHPNQSCADVGFCADVSEPGDDCGGAAAVGTVAAVQGTDCTQPPPLGVCREITDGMIAIDTACTTTDGYGPVGGQSDWFGNDVWYCYTTTCTGSMYLSMCNSGIYWGGMDSYLAIHHDYDNPTECPCPGRTTQFQVHESDEGCNGLMDGGAGIFGPTIVFPGECWLIRAGGWGDSAADTEHGYGMIAAGCAWSIPFIAATPNLEMINKSPMPPPGLPYDGGVNRKNRYISVSVNKDPGRLNAIRVILGAKDKGRGNIPPPFDVWKGQEFFAGAPRAVCENAGQGWGVGPNPDVPGVSASPCGPALEVYKNGQDYFWAAPLVCDSANAHFMDWGTLANHCNTPGAAALDGYPCSVDADCQNVGNPNGTCGVSDVVHLYHEAVVPSHLAAGAGPIDFEAVYDISAIDSSCSMADPGSYSVPAQLHQAAWGDLVTNVATCPNWPPEESVGVISDVVALLNKFSNLPCAVQKTRADLVPCLVDANIGIPDVVASLNAFAPVPGVSGSYSDVCGTGQCGPLGLCKGGPDHGTPCTSDLDCSDDVCFGKLEVAGK